MVDKGLQWRLNFVEEGRQSAIGFRGKADCIFVGLKLFL
jgi:hypothetical protein